MLYLLFETYFWFNAVSFGKTHISSAHWSFVFGIKRLEAQMSCDKEASLRRLNFFDAHNNGFQAKNFSYLPARLNEYDLCRSLLVTNHLKLRQRFAHVST